MFVVKLFTWSTLYEQYEDANCFFEKCCLKQDSNKYFLVLIATYIQHTFLSFIYLFIYFAVIKHTHMQRAWACPMQVS